MTRVHVSRNNCRIERKDGDQKIIKGVLHERISSRVLIVYWDVDQCRPRYTAAYDCADGRQRHEWVPVTDLVGESPFKRRRYEKIDGVKIDEN